MKRYSTILSWINEAKKPREDPISDEGSDHPVSVEESDHTGEVVSRTMCHIKPEVSGGETSLVSTSTEGTRTTSTDAEESERLQKRDCCEFISKKDGKTKRRHVRCKVCTNHPSVVAMHCHRQKDGWYKLCTLHVFSLSFHPSY